MKLTMMEAIKPKPRPSSTIVQPFLHVRSLRMLHAPLVVDWILLSKSTSMIFFTVQIPFNVYFSRLDLTTEKVNSLGMHDDSISSMTYVRSTSKTLFSKHITFSSSYTDLTLRSALDNLITGSWDRTLRFWDPRSPNTQQSSHGTPERIYALDHVNNSLVVAMASRLFHIYDIRKMGTAAQERESSLKYMTRSLACMPNGEGLYLSIFPFFPTSPPHFYSQHCK